jgi:alpha-glucosidase
VAAQQADPGSTFSLYRAALHLRRARADLHTAPLTWYAAGADVLAFDRGPSFRCVVNLSDRTVPVEGTVLLSSGACAGDLPPDTAAWLSGPGAR